MTDQIARMTETDRLVPLVEIALAELLSAKQTMACPEFCPPCLASG